MAANPEGAVCPSWSLTCRPFPRTWSTKLLAYRSQDRVDIDEGKAWLRFKCQGKPIHVDCEVQDDWVDTGLFGHFVGLLETCDPKKVFIYFDLGGQDCIIGCVTRQQYASLQKVIPAVQPLT